MAIDLKAQAEWAAKFPADADGMVLIDNASYEPFIFGPFASQRDAVQFARGYHADLYINRYEAA